MSNLAFGITCCAFLAAVAIMAVAHGRQARRLDECQRSLELAERTVRMLRHNLIGPHGWEMDRTCSVWARGKWHPGCVVVAVSHKGALCVRDGHRTWWVPKTRAPRYVRFEGRDGE